MAHESSGPSGPGDVQGPTPRRRLFDYPRSNRHGLRRWLPSFKHLLTLVLLVLSGLFAAVGLVYAVTPVPHSVNAQARQQSNVWYWSDGTEITRTGSTNRQTVPLSDIPLDVQRAVLAAEDRSFYSNSGVSITGTVRALLRNAAGGTGGLQGGSTITQQYVKNVYLTQEQTLARKFKEAIISVKLDRTVSKDDILSGYLNSVYFGRGAYGIEAAAQAYYGIDVGQLTVEQGAYLAVLLNAPSANDVRNTTEAGRRRVLARWNYVLDGMVKQKWLTPEQRVGMVFPEPVDPRPAANLAGVNGYLVEMAKRYLLDHKVVDEDRLDAGGYAITTTFDKRKTEALYQTVQDQLAQSLDPAQRSADVGVRVAAASVEPDTGRIVAVYGGPNYVRQFVNDATRRDVQVGSTFKPFVLAAGLRDGVQDGDGGRDRISSRTVYNGNDNLVIRYPNGKPVLQDGVPWQPGNEDGVSYGQISLARAMDKSVNTVYAQLGMDAGPDRVVRAAVDAGLPASTPGLQPVPSVSLGTSTPSALDMASAYATFAAEGKRRDAYPVDKLTRSGNTVDLPEHDAKDAYDTQQANAVTQVLRGVVDSGTGFRAQALNRPAAGKTGTTDDNRSAWFVGYTPDLATSMGMFRENVNTHAFLSMSGVAGLPRVDGANLPTRMWTTYMRAALAGQPVAEFPEDTSGGLGGPDTSLVPPDSSTATPSAPATASSSPPAGGGTGTTAPPTTPPATGTSPPTTSVAPTGSGGGGGTSRPPSRAPNSPNAPNTPESAATPGR
ncbi:transglycosylase domain-containing protein [Embleya scabrispora]|uniref:transglycosylase domain-containing protein n=1 Tax=Embleya scabrispora TaxID=159449 RepID=UPI001319E14F|nr:transglycosylase domain-containing protein [Embleya scabrispora]MYS84381.1 penicillin-binding protein [Streptomyces sp. SID5474]